MNNIYKTIATFFGFGYAPFAPGTFGAIAACGIAIALQYGEIDYLTYNYILIALIIGFTFLGIYATDKVIGEWGKDPSKVVVDEAVGQWITLLFCPFGWKYILVGLLLFRIFDITKPFFIKKLEALPGGLGVMADDILAGIYSAICLQIILRLNIL